MSQKTISGNEELSVGVTVSNTGKRAGQEVVQLYVRISWPLVALGKRLKRFAKVYLEPGQSRTLTFKLRRDDLTFINSNNKPVAEPGDFDVLVGGLKNASH